MSIPSRTAGEIVRDVIQRDAVIRNGLARGLVNVRALARYIQVTTREDTTFEALVGAIRRYPVKEAAVDRQLMGEAITRLGMKNKIVEVVVRNEPEIPILLGKFSQMVDYGRGETLSIVSSEEDVIVVVDSSNLDKLLKIIPKKNVFSVVRSLATVSVNYKIHPPGFLATMCTEIAIDGINIWDLVHSNSDVKFVVDEKDALRTYQALERLANEGQKGNLRDGQLGFEPGG